MSKIEDKIVFGLAPAAADGDAPLLLLGIPKGAWEHMKDGKTHNLDLTRIGLPVKLMLYGGDSHSHCMKMIEGHMAKEGIPILDQRREDFTIKEPEKH